MTEATTIVPEQAEEERQPRLKRGGLFVHDAELIERLGVPEKVARRALEELDRDPRYGFPQKVKAWGDRRYFPAVAAYFEHVYGFKIVASPQRGTRYG